MADIEIPIPGGFTNKQAADLAYTGLGLSDSMFGRTQEEYGTALMLLRAMVYEWPFDQLGYDHTETALTAETGIEAKWLNVVGLCLGERLAPVIGKQLQPAFQKVKVTAYSRLCSTVGVVPEADFAPGTARGSGHRYNDLIGPYFPEVA